jgi:hypothetical protein
MAFKFGHNFGHFLGRQNRDLVEGDSRRFSSAGDIAADLLQPERHCETSMQNPVSMSHSLCR